jgi:hypothetical protein
VCTGSKGGPHHLCLQAALQVLVGKELSLTHVCICAETCYASGGLALASLKKPKLRCPDLVYSQTRSYRQSTTSGATNAASHVT